MNKDSAESNQGIVRLLGVIKRLRGPDGCPWDREQTVATLKPFLIEEAYEVIEAIDSDDTAHHLEELGDLLLQILLQAQIRHEEGLFSFNDVSHVLADKLIRRHPHVFGDVTVNGSEDVLRNWETIKAAEKREKAAPPDLLAGIPAQLPCLQKAHRIQSRAARVGFDWDKIADVIAKVDEELSEVKVAIGEGQQPQTEDEIGDLLFAVVNLCRFVDVNPEEALRGTIGKFTRRFTEVERRLAAQGKAMTDSTLADMDVLWNQVKAEEAIRTA